MWRAPDSRHLLGVNENMAEVRRLEVVTVSSMKATRSLPIECSKVSMAMIG